MSTRPKRSIQHTFAFVSSQKFPGSFPRLPNSFPIRPFNSLICRYSGGWEGEGRREGLRGVGRRAGGGDD